MKYQANIGIILRDDELLQKYNFEQIEVETDYGTCKRVYIGKIGNNNVAMLYGRFEGMRTPSWGINYKQNQMAFSELGVKFIIGTFIVGSISSAHRAGDIFVPDNFVGLNSYYENLIVDRPFKNVDVYEPFCPNVRKAIMSSAEKINIPTKEGVYLSFTGLPRIETKAELNLYEKLGLDIVGQTLDPEVTLAKQMGCHYGAVCALTDDVTIRKMFSDKPEESRKINNSFIKSGRKKMAEIIETMLISTDFGEMSGCSCEYKFTEEENFFSDKPL